MGSDSMPVFVFGCISCGKTVSGNESSCPRCGVSFEGALFECPFCGELVSPLQRKCPKCGTEFSAFADEVSSTSAIDLDGEDLAIQPEQTKAKDPMESDSGEILGYECPACGKPVSENDSKCPHCGAAFQ